MSSEAPPPGSGVTRRRLLQVAGGGAIGLAGAGVGYAAGNAEASSNPADGAVPFYGEHQAGILTPPQDRLMFAAFDLTISTKAELQELLRSWSSAAVLMTAGVPAGPPAGNLAAPPADTGEAVGLPASRLTMTFGLGPSVFLQDGEDRFGLASRRPAALTPLGPLPGDLLIPGRSDGDICVQACAEDPQVAFHAVRDLARRARGAAVIRWTQLGFGRAASTSKSQVTPRNLQGFKDGTNNLDTNDDAAMDRYVWVPRSEPQAWMRGGSYVVSRRIRMLIETWDRSSLGDQQGTIGRDKIEGAPLGESKEHDPVNLSAHQAERAAGDPRGCAHPPRVARHHRRDQDPAPRLQLHRRDRPGHGRARRRPLLHLLPAGSARPVRGAPAAPRHAGRAQRVHPPHLERALRRAAGGRQGRLHRPGPLRGLSERSPDEVSVRGSPRPHTGGSSDEHTRGGLSPSVAAFAR